MKLMLNNCIVEKKVSTRENRYKNAEYGESMGIWTVAGHGVRTNKKCNTFKSVYTSEDKKEAVVKGYNCRKLSCPECSHGAASSKAQKIAIKILARAKHTHKNIYHWTFHFGDKTTMLGGEYDLMADNRVVTPTKYWGDIVRYENVRTNYQYYSSMRKKFAHFLIASGIEYAVLIFHPGHLGDDDKIHWFPHWHVIGIGKIILKSDEFFKMYGFTYRNQGKRQFGWQVASTISYCLNHCGTLHEKQSYYWINKTETKDVIRKEALPYSDEHGNYYKLNSSAYSCKGTVRIIDPELEQKAFVMNDKFVLKIKDPSDWELEDKNWGGMDRVVLCYVRLKCSYGHFQVLSDIFDVPKRLKNAYFDTMSWSKEERRMKVHNWEKYRIACSDIRNWESQYIKYRGNLAPLLNKNSKKYRNTISPTS